jgi:O-antigen ligase
MSKNKKKTYVPTMTKIKDLQWYYLLPLIFIVAVLPLIVFAKVITVEGLERINWKGPESNIDFFSYYKSLYFIGASYISFLLLVLLKITGQFEFRKSKAYIKYYIPLVIYILFVALSYFNATDKIVAGRGFIELFQGVWVLIGYALVVVAVINMVHNEKQVKLLVGAYVFVGLVTAVIGASQYFGRDIFRTDFAKMLFLPEYLHHIAEGLEFKFGKYTIYATMYNTNYVGSFGAMLLSLAVALFMYAKERKQIIASGIFMALMAFVLLGSNSRAGFVGFAFGMIFIIFLFRKSFKPNLRKILGIMVAGVIILILMNAFSNGRVLKEFQSLRLSLETERLENTNKKNVFIKDLIFDEYSLQVVTSRESLTILYDGNQITFEDTEGQPLAIKKIGKNITFPDERYFNYIIKLDTENHNFEADIYNQSFKIYFVNDGFRMIGSGGVLGVTDYPDRLRFLDGYERFGSSRGYIWSRSVPILKETLLIGKGPDMYTIVFPQKDYVGKMIAFDNESMIVDKPHNMYLQVGINTGVLSLLALLAVYGMYFFDSMKIYTRRRMTTFIDHVGVGTFTAVMSYLGAAFFNDQIISVAPLFYVMVGLGIAINQQVKGTL